MVVMILARRCSPTKLFDGLAGFGVVGDDDAGEEEAGEHLAPGGPGFVVLIDDGGVAGEVDDWFVGDWFDVDGADAGVVAVELEGEFVVPVEDAELAGFEFYLRGRSRQRFRDSGRWCRS